MQYKHVPVMLKEVLEYFNPQSGQYYIDCTLGGAGYTMAIAQKVGDKGKVLAIDLDREAIKNAGDITKDEKLKNIILVNDNFKNLQKNVDKYFEKDTKFNGIVCDLGLSSAQLKDRSRGFSFLADAPLDMSFRGRKRAQEGEEGNRITEFIINKWKQKELEKIIREYGEERFAGRIARKIAEARRAKPIKTTWQLVEIIRNAVPQKYVHSRIHFATRVFQALRIATNDELESLKKALPQAVELLKPGGRLAIISFHSLEDRIVKQFFKKESKDCLCPPNFLNCQCGHKAKLKILTKKVVVPSENEIKNNQRARSAKMRVAEKI